MRRGMVQQRPIVREVSRRTIRELRPFGIPQ